MPLIVLCGYPSSGKTTTSTQLKEFFEEKNIKVKVISENFLVNEKKNEIYSCKFDQFFFFFIMLEKAYPNFLLYKLFILISFLSFVFIIVSDSFN